MGWFEELGSAAAEAITNSAESSGHLLVFYPPSVDGVAAAFLIRAALEESSVETSSFPTRPEGLLTTLEESLRIDSEGAALVLCNPPPPSLAQLSTEVFQSLVVLDSSLPGAPDLRGLGVRINPLLLGWPELPCSLISLAAAVHMAPDTATLCWIGLLGFMFEGEYSSVAGGISIPGRPPSWGEVHRLRTILAGALLAEPESAPHLIQGVLMEVWDDPYRLLIGRSATVEIVRASSQKAAEGARRSVAARRMGPFSVVETEPDRRLPLADLLAGDGPALIYDDDGIVAHASVRRHGVSAMERFLSLNVGDFYVSGGGREAEIVARSSLMGLIFDALLGR